MEKQNNRGQWGSSFGFLMAAVGSAVGLGNIWGFPYKMGANGGFAFLLVYISLAVLVGFPIMISELAIGRKVGSSVIVAYRTISKKFTWVGWLAMLSPFLIMGFYCVLGAYCLEYFVINFKDLVGLADYSAIDGGTIFGNMITDQMGAVIYTAIFMLMCFLIIKGGIKDGIEKFNSIGMPALFVMLVVVIIRSVTLPGAAEGLKFMFTPNFQPLKENFVGVLSSAGGQMFFSLSLAMGITVTYGSYLSKSESLVKNGLLIIVSDTIVALMAGMAVLPAAFALGGEGANLAGPKLLFITLQDVFASMGFTGPIFGMMFYLLVFIAAITSAVALTEVMVTFFVDNASSKGKSANRTLIVALVCLAIMAEGVLVALDGLGSNGLWIPFQSTGMPFAGSWLDFLDCISEGIAMPLGAMVTAIMVGWIIGPKVIQKEVTLEGNSFKSYGFFKFCVRFTAPAIMFLVLLGQVDSFFALGIF